MATVNGTTSKSLDERLSRFEVEMNDLIHDITSSEDNDLKKRLSKTLFPAARKAETPRDFAWRMFFVVNEYAVWRTALDLKIAQKMAESENEGGIMSLKELSQATGADEVLLRRLLRVLVPLGVFTEAGRDSYGLSEVSRLVLQEPSIEGGVKFTFDVMGPPLMKMPAFLAETKYANPKSQPGPFQSAFGDLTCFEYLMQHPSSAQDFSELMAGQRLHRLEWFDFFPVQENLLNGFKRDDVLLIDVGGNRGHELQAFRKRFPDVRGRLILQDLPAVVSTLTDHSLEKEDIEVMEHDFFTEQPVQGARAYYFRSCFHDWPDDKCKEILQRIAVAMTPEYSKLIINDWVLPDEKCSLYPGLLDITLLANFCGMERTESQWKTLIEEEGLGLKIEKIHTAPDTEGCIEIVKTA